MPSKSKHVGKWMMKLAASLTGRCRRSVVQYQFSVDYKQKNGNQQGLTANWVWWYYDKWSFYIGDLCQCL